MLLLALSAAPARATSQGPAPIDRTSELQGITFHVTSPSVQSGNVVVGEAGWALKVDRVTEF